MAAVPLAVVAVTAVQGAAPLVAVVLVAVAWRTVVLVAVVAVTAVQGAVVAVVPVAVAIAVVTAAVVLVAVVAVTAVQGAVPTAAVVLVARNVDCDCRSWLLDGCGSSGPACACCGCGCDLLIRLWPGCMHGCRGASVPAILLVMVVVVRLRIARR